MIDLSSLKLKREIDRVNILQWGHFCVLILSLIWQSIITSSPVSGAFRLILLGLFYRLQFKALKNHLYSFWTFSIIATLYVFYSIYNNFSSYEDFQLFYLYIVFILVISVQSYILLSPIYYPMVSWWEYDFRYRFDSKILLHKKDEKVEGRLTDLRRGAGCLIHFEDIPLGEKVKISTSNGHKEFTFKMEIMSKRQYSLGRPYNYGVKFIFDEGSPLENYKEFLSFWLNEKRVKKIKKLEVKSAEV